MPEARIDAYIQLLAALYFLLNALYFQRLVSFCTRWFGKKDISENQIYVMRGAAAVLSVVMLISGTVAAYKAGIF